MKKNTKKIALILAGAMLLGIFAAGCGKKAETDVANEVAAETDASAPEAASETDAEASEQVYEDPNGWSVRYDPSKIEVTNEDNKVAFVYTGESAGTNMVLVTYEAGSDAKAYADELAESWGENASVSEGIFPGTEDAPGYWVTLPPAEEGSGMYMTAIVRDYMEGHLVFELTGHNSGDDEMDMAVGDTLAMIIDSVQF